VIEGIINFIQAIFPIVKVKHIVVDLLKDTNNKVWVTDIKHFKLIKFLSFSAKVAQDENNLMARTMLIHMSKLRQKVTKCFMCKEYKQKVINIFAKRLIYLTKLSLLHRGVSDYCMFKLHQSKKQPTIPKSQRSFYNLYIKKEEQELSHTNYFSESKYLESHISLADSMSTCLTCFSCKRIIEEEMELRRKSTNFCQELKFSTFNETTFIVRQRQLP